MQITQDQREFQDLVRRFLLDLITPEYLRSRVEGDLRCDSDLLRSIEALGLREAFSGQTPSSFLPELGILFSEAGRALLPEAVCERVLLDYLLPHHLSSDTKEAYAALAVGEGVTAVAPPSSCDLEVDPTSGCVSGKIAWGWGVEGANRIVAFAPVHGESRAVAIPLAREGVSTCKVSSLDLTTCLTSLSLSSVASVVLSPSESAFALHALRALKACEVYGVTARVTEMTVEYLKTREQFGVPVGAFQALQQKLADAYAKSESLGALARFAVWALHRSDGQQAALGAAAAISEASEAGPVVCESAIQCHGGIGFTWEYDLHLYLRRVRVIQSGFPLSAQISELLGSSRG